MVERRNVSRALGRAVLSLNRKDRAHWCPAGFAPFTVPSNAPTIGLSRPAISWYAYNRVGHWGPVWVVVTEKYGIACGGVPIEGHPLWLEKVS